MICQPSIFGSPHFLHGTGFFGGCYDASRSGYNAKVSQPLAPGVTIVFRAPNGAPRAHISSNSGNNPIVACSFEVTEKGPARADIELLRLPPNTDPVVLAHGSWFEIRLWGQTRPLWSGTVVKNPGVDSTERSIKLQGLGWVAFADDLKAHGLYETVPFGTVILENVAIYEIMQTFGSTFGLHTFCNYNDEKIVQDEQSAVEMTKLVYVRTPFDQVFDEAAKIAGNWVWGIDVDHELFFRPVNADISPERTLVVGRDFQDWEPEEDSSGLLNQLHIRHGNTNVDQTSPAFGTNYLPGLVEDAASQNTYGLRAGDVTAPSLYSELDAYRYAQAELEKKKVPAIRAQAPKLTFNGTPYEAGYTYRVVTKNGYSDHVCKRVKYEVKPSGRTEVTLSLGEETDDLALWALDLQRSRARTEAEQRAAQYTSIEARPPS